MPKRSALVIVTLASFLAPLMGSSANIALPSMGKEFSMEAVLIGWISTSYLLAAAMFLVPFGSIADIYGRKRVFTYGITIYTVASLFSAFSTCLSPQSAGLILISQPIVMAVFSPFAGRLSDRIEPRIVASMGMTLLASGLFLFVFLSKRSPFEFIVANLTLHGFGFAIFSSPNTNAVMSSVKQKFFGVASGTLGTMRMTGMMFSMGIAMFIFALYIGRVEITPEHYPQFLISVKLIFTIFTILCFSGIFASFARGKVR